jgi:hypothetical protein
MSAKEQADAMRSVRRRSIVEALREGRKERAARFIDRKKEASRKACREPVREDG